MKSLEVWLRLGTVTQDTSRITRNSGTNASVRVTTDVRYLQVLTWDLSLPLTFRESFQIRKSLNRLS